jgi:hypothetical protein
VRLIGYILLAVLALLALRWLLARRPKVRERTQIKALLRACDDDQAMAERLIFAEMERDPDISFGEAARRARWRLTRDRR